MSEADLHKAVAEHLDAVIDGRRCVWSTIPAGGGGKVRGAQLKGMGLKPGLPDLMFVFGGRVAFIELKTKTGRVSPEQTVMHARLKDQDAPPIICRDLPSVDAALKFFGIPTRGRVNA